MLNPYNESQIGMTISTLRLLRDRLAESTEFVSKSAYRERQKQSSIVRRMSVLEMVSVVCWSSAKAMTTYAFGLPEFSTC